MENDSPNFILEFFQFRNFVNDISKENDRAAVIISSAKLDLQLYQIIQKFLLPCPSSKDELLDNEGPLSSFNSRINFVHRAGLIHADMAKALHLIRKIRNSFAHELSNVSLTTGSHADRVKELCAPFRNTIFYEKYKKEYFENDVTQSANFKMVVAVISARLDAVYNNLIPLNDNNAWDLIPPDENLIK